MKKTNYNILLNFLCRNLVTRKKFVTQRTAEFLYIFLCGSPRKPLRLSALHKALQKLQKGDQPNHAV